MGAIEMILGRADKLEILKLYKIQDYSSWKQFLCNVAMSRGKLKKGGIADLEVAA